MSKIRSENTMVEDLVLVDSVILICIWLGDSPIFYFQSFNRRSMVSKL